MSGCKARLIDLFSNSDLKIFRKTVIFVFEVSKIKSLFFIFGPL